MTDRIKIRPDISLDDMGDALLLQRPTEGSQALMRAAARTVAVAAVVEYGLVDGLQHAFGRCFNNRFLTQMYARFWGGLADPGVGLTAGISQKPPGFRGFCS